MEALADDPSGLGYGAREHPLYGQGVCEDALPYVADMRAAADELARAPTAAIRTRTLSLGGVGRRTELYYAITDVVFQSGLDALIASGAGYAQVSKYVSDKNQGPRLAGGTAFENHFHTVLHDRAIDHTSQCVADDGERPDFVFPGCTHYHDSAFRSERLRMVGCKSTLKDRWRQGPARGSRIEAKYVLTLDRRLTATLDGQHARGQSEDLHPGPLIAEGMRIVRSAMAFTMSPS